MKKLLMILGTAAALLTLGANGLEEGFRSPPRSASPHALYHLMNGNFCGEAWDAISRYVYAALQGGRMRKVSPFDMFTLSICVQ